eukprot:TRINITY_DN21759_c0_g1_i1.p1 TRINITY_DN21759_c0_g1~~TRINITY_DN21759_c0_g1_i1.p1  ORF type:complete len:370 (+),score=162.28 TRINITY_DN21759_c0_g1_i1:75-1112(+)
MPKSRSHKKKTSKHPDEMTPEEIQDQLKALAKIAANKGIKSDVLAPADDKKDDDKEEHPVLDGLDVVDEIAESTQARVARVLRGNPRDGDRTVQMTAQGPKIERTPNSSVVLQASAKKRAKKRKPVAQPNFDDIIDVDTEDEGDFPEVSQPSAKRQRSISGGGGPPPQPAAAAAAAPAAPAGVPWRDLTKEKQSYIVAKLKERVFAASNEALLKNWLAQQTYENKDKKISKSALIELFRDFRKAPDIRELYAKQCRENGQVGAAKRKLRSTDILVKAKTAQIKITATVDTLVADLKQRVVDSVKTYTGESYFVPNISILINRKTAADDHKLVEGDLTTLAINIKK